MKRTCNNCIAENYSGGCALGYKNNEKLSKIIGIRGEQYPNEECPKPITIKRYIELTKNGNEKFKI